MDTSSTYKLLYLLNLLSEGEYTKNEIMEKFASLDIPVARSLVARYLELFENSEFDIENKTNIKKEGTYSLKQEDYTLELTREELDVISDVKKLLIAQKNYDRIRKTMRLFYKLSKYISDEDVKREFIDFGYYSTLNWLMIRRLEKHCLQKNVITLQYIIPQGDCREITIHTDALKVSDWSQRLYLHGMFEGSKHFSHLPVDRIFMIKEVVKKNKRFDILTNMLTYTVSKTLYNSMYADSREKITETTQDRVTIQRPIDDEFYLIQRLLAFCPEIYYISDDRIRMLFKEKLEILRASYGDELDR